MSVLNVAQKDFQDAVRSMLLWALTGLLLILVAGLAAVPYLIEDDPGFMDALNFLFTPIGILIPVIGLIVGYQAIVGERESGSIRFLIGLPNTRLEVLLGKFLGRSAVVALPTMVGFLVGGIVVLALYDGFEVGDFVGLFLFSILMGVVYVALAVGVSASVTSRAKAVAGVAGIFIVFDWIWQFVPLAIYWLLEGELPGFTNVPAWFIFVERLSPSQALTAIAIDLVDFVDAEQVDLTAAGRIAGEVPFYVDLWVSWLIVILWIVIPLGIGYARFRTAIIN